MLYGHPVYGMRGGAEVVIGCEPWAAIITKVHEDGTVNLRVFNPVAYAGADEHHVHVKYGSADVCHWWWPL